MDNIYYFGYGMHVNPTSMQLRCSNSTAVGPAILDGWQLQFCYHANVVESAGHHVTGVLWSVTQRCLDVMDTIEGYPHYYDRAMVDVLSGGKHYKAWIYFMAGNTGLEPPNDEYVHLIQEGYNYFGMDSTVLRTAIQQSSTSRIDK